MRFRTQVEPRAAIDGIDKCLHQKSRAGDEQECDRDLCTHQHAADACGGFSASKRAAHVAYAGVRTLLRKEERGAEAEPHTTERAEDDGEPGNADIDSHRGPVG